MRYSAVFYLGMKDRATRRSFLIGASATVASVPLLARAQQSDNGKVPLSDTFIKRLPQLMEWANVPGLAIATVKNGKPEWSRSFGVTKAGETTPVTSETIFPAASLSKPLLAYLILKLRDEKQFDIDRPLWHYLPYPDLPMVDDAKLITARHVLSHSSGLQNWRFGPDDKLALAFKPGQRFQYSGEGFYYLQRVIEELTGSGFAGYMNERVLKPLGMKSSTFLWTPRAEKLTTWGHNGRMEPREGFSARRGRAYAELADKWAKPLSTWTHEDAVKAHAAIEKDSPARPDSLLPNAAASLLTTVDEYATFLTRLLRASGDKLDLSEASRRDMYTTQTKINTAVGWGLGVGVESYEGRTHIWHWGDNGIFKAFMMGEPATGNGVVIFLNAQNGHKVWQRILTENMGPDHPASYFFMT